MDSELQWIRHAWNWNFESGDGCSDMLPAIASRANRIHCFRERNRFGHNGVDLCARCL